jgi:hypothetical protein
MTAPTFTARQKMQEAQREVGYRRFVYAKRVNDGKMKQAEANRLIAIMTEMAADYGALADKEEQAGRLL